MVSAGGGATRRGEAVAYIDPLDMFDPPSAAASGVDFSRMLWIRGEATSSARVSLSCEYGTLQKSVDRAVKSLNSILQAGGFGLVVLDLAEIRRRCCAVCRLPPGCGCIASSRAAIRCAAAGRRAHFTQRWGSDGAPGRASASDFGLRQALARAWSLEPGAGSSVTARVVRARAGETPNVCLPVSAAAC
jgi:hypothetical protein